MNGWLLDNGDIEFRFECEQLPHDIFRLLRIEYPYDQMMHGAYAQRQSIGVGVGRTGKVNLGSYVFLLPAPEAFGHPPRHKYSYSPNHNCYPQHLKYDDDDIEIHLEQLNIDQKWSNRVWDISIGL